MPGQWLAAGEGRGQIAVAVQPSRYEKGKMSQRRSSILLTGFGPFPGVPENVTTRLVPKLASLARRRWRGHHIEAAVLPTEWRAGPAAVAELLDALKPAVVLHFGVARTSVGFTIESRGLNRARLITDAAGLLPPSGRLSLAGPDVLAASIPTARIIERLRRRSLPVSLSHDAGGYLCNAVLYGSLERALSAAWPMRSGFIHLPPALRDAADVAPRRTAVRLDWDQALEGSLEILAATLGQPVA